MEAKCYWIKTTGEIVEISHDKALSMKRGLIVGKYPSGDFYLKQDNDAIYLDPKRGKALRQVLSPLQKLIVED